MISLLFVLLTGGFEAGLIRLPVKVETMTASWYGPGFCGRPMASGEIFHREDPVVAHPDLPFGTKLIIINPETNQVVAATVLDRGPFVGDRDLDVSETLADRLGFKDKGIETLTVIIVN